jgi:hypothetical protein
MVPSDIIKIGMDEVLWCEGVKSHCVSGLGISEAKVLE